MANRIFTLQEANQLLPELEIKLKTLLQKKETYSRRHDELFMHELLKQAESGTHSEKNSDDLEVEIQKMEAAITDLEKDLEAIKELGCTLRNIERGYVDFLGQKDGELIYFCWKIGESSIQFYHPLQHGTRNRIPLAG